MYFCDVISEGLSWGQVDAAAAGSVSELLSQPSPGQVPELPWAERCDQH